MSVQIRGLKDLAYINVHRLAIRVLDCRVIALNEDTLNELGCELLASVEFSLEM